MKYLLLPLVFFLISCNDRSSEEEIENMNGYWMISKMQTESGDVREFKFAPTVDYIEIENKKGFRKKVKPRFDGTFIVTKDDENITVKVENDSINLYYTTKLDEWKETLISSNENQLIFANEDGKQYIYERYEGILTETDGKTK